MRRPPRSCASRRKVCACWKWRSVSIWRSASPACSPSAARVPSRHASQSGSASSTRASSNSSSSSGCRVRYSAAHAGGAIRLRDARQQRRMLDDQRQIGAAPADRLQQRQQAREDHLRAGRAGMARPRRRAAAAPAHRSAAATARATAGSGCWRARGRGVASSASGSANPAAASCSRDGGGGRRLLPDRRERVGRLPALAARDRRRPARTARRPARDGARARRRIAPARRSPSPRPAVRARRHRAGSWCVCWSSRYCSRCSMRRRNS